ncbi:MAG TPA: 3'-5' exonuclease [Lacunisphaera sp.]|nr:3'-5' exonuclease [Lacunisphaera sp.]
MSTPQPFQQPVLVVDVETSGFDPQRNACLELGAILLDTTLKPVAQFSSLIAPWKGAELVPQAMAVNRISAEELKTAPTAAQALERFHAEMVGSKAAPLLAGWNIWFDAGFLRNLYERAERPWPFRHRLLDVQSIALFHSRFGAGSQEVAIKEHLDDQQKHRALPDALHTARLLQQFAERHLSKASGP